MTFASSRFEAIGASNEILATNPESSARAVAYAKSHLARLSAAASRFRTDSEVSRLARLRLSTGPGGDPGGAPLCDTVWTIISPTLAAYLGVALEAARSTDGLVDPTIGAALQASGYDADIVEVRSRVPSTVDSAAIPGWRRIKFDPKTRLLEMPPGTVLDLGATAKAHAADIIAADLAQRLSGGFLVNLGGDIAVGGPPPEGGWHVGVESADGTVRQVVVIRDGAVTTSSTRLRRWPTTTGERHHIIDPRSGLSAPETWAQVTCVATSAAKANSASTAAIIVGNEAPAWLARRGIAARLDALDGGVILTPGWPDHPDEAAA